MTLKEVKSIAKPCPFCGSSSLSFIFSTHSGHGDSSFSNARIMCNSCTAAKGNGAGYGSPTEQDEVILWMQWNVRINLQS